MINSFNSFKKIIKVCKQLPAVEFWLPTSRDDILIEYFEKGKGTIPKNLIIRYSAPQIAQSMPAFMVDLLKKWCVTYTETTMDATKATCHASIDGGSCELCEDCFKLIPITYLIHGVQARKNTDDLMEFRK